MIFLSFGIPKSASSFVYQMTFYAFETLEVEGHGKLGHLKKLFSDFPFFPETAFAESALKEGLMIEEPSEKMERIRYLDRLIDEMVERIKGANTEHYVIKTHLPCSPKIAKHIEDGAILASATFRHPAEMILSRQDMALKNNEPLNIDLLNAYQLCIDDFYTWVCLPQVRRYYFDNIVLNPDIVCADIFKHVGATANYVHFLDQLINEKKRKIWQFNKGQINRASSEMSEEQLLNIEEFFAEYMAFIEKHKLHWQ